MKLIIGNKNYSTWSMRPWLVLKAFGIVFEEETALLSGEGWQAHIRSVSPSGRVPVLIDDDLVIPESLAIIEYLSERFPELAIWPADTAQRARARSVSAEMHGGFTALRRAAPMNLRASHPGRVDPAHFARDLARIEAIWGDAVGASGGPFLFGTFSAANAMFAPVVSRFGTYAIAVSAAAHRYMDAVMADPAYIEWKAGALAEPWIIADDEIDVIQARAAGP